jgi:hypothetical protein
MLPMGGRAFCLRAMIYESCLLVVITDNILGADHDLYTYPHSRFWTTFEWSDSVGTYVCILRVPTACILCCAMRD